MKTLLLLFALVSVLTSATRLKPNQNCDTKSLVKLLNSTPNAKVRLLKGGKIGMKCERNSHLIYHSRTINCSRDGRIPRNVLPKCVKTITGPTRGKTAKPLNGNRNRRDPKKPLNGSIYRQDPKRDFRIQNDDSNANLVGQVNSNWRSYGNDIVGHPDPTNSAMKKHTDSGEQEEGEVMVILQEEGELGEDNKRNGVYETTSIDQGEYGIYDEEYAEYDYKHEDGKNENGNSSDYGQYYDYEYDDSPKVHEQSPDEDGDVPEENGQVDDNVTASTSQEIHSDENLDEIDENVEITTTDSNVHSSSESSEIISEDYRNQYDNSTDENVPEGSDNDDDMIDSSNGDYDEYDEEYNEEYEERAYDNESQEGDSYDYEEEYDDGEEEQEGDEEQQLYRNYEILSDFYKKHFVDLRVLDTSCVPEEIPPPQIAHGFVKEYKTTENVLFPGKHYHEVIYQCEEGYKLTDSGLGHMFCQQQGWMGLQPYCEEDPDVEARTFDETLSHVEALDNAEQCEENQGCEQICRMVQGQPTCFCEEGYQLVDVTACVDVDECAVANGGCSHICINKPGTYTCECPPGFQADGGDCIDINECVANNGHGPCQDVCENTDGGFICSCENLPGTQLSPDGKNCNTTDLCQENNGGCSHECYTTYGQSFCMCPSGYKLEEDWKTCVDVDECQSMSSIQAQCSGGCQNTPGSFICIEDELVSVESRQYCDNGYEFDATNNVCVDINECQEDASICGSGSCHNLEPGYRCDCPSGFSIDGQDCQDVDECYEDPGICGNGLCTNTPGSYECDCYDGFEKINNSCTDIDECLTKCQNGDCFNTEGAFDCTCFEGYILDDYGDCVDVNECDHYNPCGRAICVNTPGSYNCTCRGNRIYSSELKRCRRPNPCRQEPHPCGQHGTCKMTKLEHTCICEDGYQSLNGSSCSDVDECLADNGGCEQLCENNDGTFKCGCKDGFSIDPNDAKKCVDIDECSEKYPCEQECTNTNGSYFCSCIEGYELDKSGDSQCIPVTTCPQKCSHECVNNMCSCPSGFDLSAEDNATCIKVQLGCYDMTSMEGMQIHCSKKKQGSKYPPGTICRGRCIEDFVPSDGRLKKKCRSDGSWSGTNGQCTQIFCDPIQLNENVLVTPAECSSAPSLVKQRCKFSCKSGEKLLGSKSARCRRNRQWKQHGGPSKCVPIDDDPLAITTTTSTIATTTISSTVEPYQNLFTSTVTTPTFMVPTLPLPYVYCPPDIVKNLTSESPTVYIRIPQPKTNVNWYDYIKATPNWAKNLEADLPLGKTLVTFQAMSPVSDASSSCSFTIHVRDVIPPRVYNCPGDFQVYLDQGQVKRQVFWEEPIFADNVKIMHVMASKMPGQLLTEGKHSVLYQASDEDGNQARCAFTITVHNARQLDIGRRSWVVCRVGSTGRLIRLFVAHVPRGCWKLTANDI